MKFLTQILQNLSPDIEALVLTAAMLHASIPGGGLGQNPMMGHFFAPVIFGGALTRYIRKFISWHTHAEMRDH